MTEDEMIVGGENRYLSKVYAASQRGQISLASRSAANLVAFLTDTASLSLNKEIAAGGVGPAFRAHPFLKQVGVKRACAIASRVLIDRMLSPGNYKTRLSTVLTYIGTAIHEQAMFEFYGVEFGTELLDDVKRRNAEKFYNRGRMKNLVKAHLKTEWTEWTQGERLATATACLNHIMAATDFFEVETIRGRKTQKFIRATDTLLARVRTQDIRVGMMSPLFLPITTPPKDWVSPTEGGFEKIPLTLVKGARGERLQNLREADLSEVYDAVNKLQKTPFRVNKNVLVVAEYFWKEGSSIAGLPTQDPTPQPEFPMDQEGVPWESLTESQQAIRQEWKSAVKDCYSQDRAKKSQILATRAALEAAATFESEKAIYLVQTIDFRGRVYSCSRWDYRAGKLDKSLFEFAYGKPITERGQAPYLIHGANVWGNGVEKRSLSERIDWALDNQEMIISISEDPVANQWWAEAENPWEFLAWAIEAGEWFEGGRSLDFVSHLPIHADQSCSAIAHWSAAMRQEDEARRVNLTGGEMSDIYTEILDVLREDLQKSEDPKAAWLLSSPYMVRKLTKRAAMMIPYSGTRRGIQNHVRQLTRSIDKAHSLKEAAGEDLSKYVNFIANKIWDAIHNTLVGTMQGMKYTHDVCRIVNAMELSLSWVSPCGLPVQLDYHQFKKRRISLHLLGDVYTPIIRGQVQKVDKRKQLSSVAPSLIHSLDACLLIRAVNAAKGIPLMTIHDSFGCHAQHYEEMNQHLRLEFLKLYQGNMLEEWKDSVLNSKVLNGAEPEVLEMVEGLQSPKRGSLDLTKILESVYAFS